MEQEWDIGSHEAWTDLVEHFFMVLDVQLLWI